MKKQNGSKKLSDKKQRKLHEFIVKRNDEAAKQLICVMEDVNEELNYFGSFETPLSLSCRYGRTELVKLLIELGADVNKIIDNEYSPLMYAAYGNVEIVQILLHAGADINYSKRKGESALSEAVQSNHFDIFELLIARGISIEKYGGVTLIYACSSRNVNINIQMIERLFELGVNANFMCFDNGYTALHWACERNNLKFVELLMENGADEKIISNDGKTPIELTTNEEIKEFINNYICCKFVLK